MVREGAFKSRLSSQDSISFERKLSTRTANVHLTEIIAPAHEIQELGRGTTPLLSRYCDKNFHTQPCWAEIERIAGQLKRPEQAKTAELEHIYGT